MTVYGGGGYGGPTPAPRPAPPPAPPPAVVSQGPGTPPIIMPTGPSNTAPPPSAAQVSAGAYHAAQAAHAAQQGHATLAQLVGKALAAQPQHSAWNTVPVTPVTWSHALLSALGAPATAANMQALVSWVTAEGGHWNNQAKFNPLNTKQDAPGAVSPPGFVSAGIKAYPDWLTGLKATVATLTNGNYGQILSALKQGNNAQAVPQAVAASPWGTGGFSLQSAPPGGGSWQQAAQIAVGPVTSTAPQVKQSPKQRKQFNQNFNQSFNQEWALLHSPIATSSAATLAPSRSNPGAFAAYARTTGIPNKPAAPSAPKQFYTNPLPGFTLGRTDMGVDANAPVGTPIRAIGDSKVTSVHPFYQGQPLYEFQFTNGPRQGQYWYVAEQIASNLKPGDTVKAGQPVGTYAPSGTGIEIGFGGDAAGSTLAQTTSGYTEGQQTPAGKDFHAFLDQLAKNPAAASAGGGSPPSPSSGAASTGTGSTAPSSGGSTPGGAVSPSGDTGMQAQAQTQQQALLAQLMGQGQGPQSTLQSLLSQNPGNLWNTVPSGGGVDAFAGLSGGDMAGLLGLAQTSLQSLVPNMKLRGLGAIPLP